MREDLSTQKGRAEYIKHKTGISEEATKRALRSAGFDPNLGRGLEHELPKTSQRKIATSLRQAEALFGENDLTLTEAKRGFKIQIKGIKRAILMAKYSAQEAIEALSEVAMRMVDFLYSIGSALVTIWERFLDSLVACFS